MQPDPSGLDLFLVHLCPLCQQLPEEDRQVFDLVQVKPHPQLLPGRAHQTMALAQDVTSWTIFADKSLFIISKLIFEICWDVVYHLRSDPKG